MFELGENEMIKPNVKSRIQPQKTNLITFDSSNLIITRSIDTTSVKEPNKIRVRKRIPKAAVKKFQDDLKQLININREKEYLLKTQEIARVGLNIKVKM